MGLFAPAVDLSVSPIFILLTGVTIISGMVILEELVRQRNEGSLHYDKFVVLIRAAGGRSSSETFQDRILNLVTLLF